jgi:hypothetical protein
MRVRSGELGQQFVIELLSVPQQRLRGDFSRTLQLFGRKKQKKKKKKKKKGATGKHRVILACFAL